MDAAALADEEEDAVGEVEGVPQEGVVDLLAVADAVRYGFHNALAFADQSTLQVEDAVEESRSAVHL